MRNQRRTLPAVESLEEKALLSVTGGPGLQVSPALSNTDVQALQQIASLNNQQEFLAQLGVLLGFGTTLRTNAQAMLNSSRDLDLQVQSLAQMFGTVVPSGISPSDQAVSQQVVSAISTSQFDTTYLIGSFQNNAKLLGQLVSLMNSTQNPQVKTGATNGVIIVYQELLGELGVLNGTGTGVGPGMTAQSTPSTTTLSSSDLQTLETAYSTTQTERFLAQLTAVQTKNPDVDQYAEKLINDHEQESIQTGLYAAATGTFLPAGVQGMDVQTSTSVIAFANKPSYDRNYLQTMVQSHTQDIQSNQQTIATTQNPTLRAFAMDDIPTDWMHRAGAEWLLQGQSRSGRRVRGLRSLR